MSSIVSRASLLDDLYGVPALRDLFRPLHGDPLPDARRIRIDVRENDAEYVVYAELPGVRKEDVEINVDGKTITIKAEVNQKDQETRDGKLIHVECYCGMVSRSFAVASEIDRSKSKAKYENGVLVLTLPKAKAGPHGRLTVE